MNSHDPNARIPQDTSFSSGRRFAQLATDLTDSEVQRAFEIIVSVRDKFVGRPTTDQNLRELEDEVVTRLHGIGVLSKVDPTPLLEGKPPVVVIIGKVGFGSFSQTPTDHERKSHEIKKAHSRGEFRLGEKEPLDSTPAKKRHASKKNSST